MNGPWKHAGVCDMIKGGQKVLAAMKRKPLSCIASHRLVIGNYQ